MADKRKILFIDDNPVDRAFIHGLLSKHDFDVLLAEDGTIGLRMVQEQKPDLVLLDILLPGISGIELCKMFKKNPATRDIPVVFYTSIDTPKNLMVYSSYGARDYFQKSMPPKDLVASIRFILKV